MKNLSKEIVKLPFPKSYEVFTRIVDDDLGYKTLDWQYNEDLKALRNRKTAWCWSRRISKSDRAARLNVFRALFGRRQAYRTPGEVQLEQPKEYMYQMEQFVDRVQKDWVYVNGKPMISTAVMTDKNIRSKKIADLTLDEMAFFESRQEKLYAPAKAMLKDCKSSTIHLISTPRRSTVFESLFKDWEKIQANVSHYNFKTVECPWIDYQAIEEDRIEWEKLGMGWMYRQEYLAEWTVAGGAIFKRLLEGPHKYSDVLKTEYWDSDVTKQRPLEFGMELSHIGADFHGEFGTVIAGGYWSRTEPGHFYFTHEGRYPNDTDELNLSFFRKFYGSAHKRVEKGGYNAGFELDSRQYGTIGADADNKSKNERLVNALRYKIHIDPDLTPNIYDDFSSAAWDEQGIYAIKDSQHPCHYLDAGLLAIPPVGMNGLYIPKQNSFKDPMLQYEKMRDQRYRMSIKNN